MGFFDKLKETANQVKANVSKQDFHDLLSDVTKDIASGNADDITKYKAAGKLLYGLGKMATGKYEGSSHKLKNIHKDPYDIQQSEEVKAELNEMLLKMLNPHKFVYGNPETIHQAGITILDSINFMGMCNDKTLLPRIHEALEQMGVRYDESILDSEINKFIRSKEPTKLLSIKHQVDKYIFIDRLSKREILAMYENFNRNIKTHYKFICKHCGRKFQERANWENFPCDAPHNTYHKLYPIDEYL